jgi:peptidoglycan hydrolase-like protein with peptidoglycan-binding domain
MSTTTATDVQRNSTGRTVGIAVACAVAGAAVTAGLVLGLGGLSAASAPSSTTSVDQSSGYSATFVPVSGHGGVPAGTPAHHVVPTPPAPPKPPAPSAAVATLQRELGQLNYYDGPITGTMNSQTTQAITYLQRDAGLPQTGTMNAATEQALVQFLAHGNNQMGS